MAVLAFIRDKAQGTKHEHVISPALPKAELIHGAGLDTPFGRSEKDAWCFSRSEATWIAKIWGRQFQGLGRPGSDRRACHSSREFKRQKAHSCHHVGVLV
ncbi:hypothetical protein SAMD00023353_1701240 [Rosellinia necatrix]|uniref:Uncharacterized protein n=1 Tax=Rosellinia necatrix TaxID=77044 RepID=A0A1S8A7F4_ROSNE|nr:hypothetical protein SAMD00023353_1701240 [Rosellinia necatrix]